jgi:hypothetical protein
MMDLLFADFAFFAIVGIISVKSNKDWADLERDLGIKDRFTD